MRFHLGAMPNSPDFTPDESWRPLKEPSLWLAQLIALPVGIAATIILVFLWLPIILSNSVETMISLPGFLLLFLCTIVIHELIHAVVHPKAGFSSHSILGFWLLYGVFYAHYDDELTRNRFIAILLMPTIVISLMPLLLSAITGIVFSWEVFASVLNVFCSCVDILGACIILYQLPASAITRNKGWKTFWKVKDPSAL